MPCTRVQVGAIGEALFTVYAIRGSDGALECFRAGADDDHRDFVVGRRGDPRTAYVQVKTDDALDRTGRVQASVRFLAGQAFEHPGFLYAVLYAPAVTIEACWLVPSPDYNGLAYREQLKGGYEQWVMQAHTRSDDAWTPYRVEPPGFGATLLRRLDSLATAGLLPAPRPESTPP